ncbi:retrovirus-related pol polyprotein from transposon TNT 1-94 [Tanacetum coccineum]
MVKEVNEIRAERIAKNANPLALVATAQPHQDPYYQTSKSHKSYAPTSKTSLPTRSHATTRHKGKEIVKPITPLSKSASEEDSNPEQAQKDKETNKSVDTALRYKNDSQTGQFGNQRTMTVVGARETVGGQSDWLADTDEEIGEQELEAHYSYMAKIQEVPTADSETDSEPLEQVQYDTGYNVFANEIQHSEQPESIINTCVVETGDSNVIPDSPDMCDNDIQNDQNAVECDDEHVVLANLIANLKLDVDENKKIQKQLKKANTTLAHDLTKCKSILVETSRSLGESNSIRDSCLVALQNKQTEFERYKNLNDRTVYYEKLEHKLNETLGLLAQKDIDIKDAEFSNMYDMLLQECVSNDVMCSYLHSLSNLDAHTKLQCLYLHKVKECDCLAQKLLKQTESVSKEVYTKLLRSFAKLEKHSISLELALQQCQEQMKDDIICKEKATTQTRAPQLPQTSKNTNPHVSTSTEVNHRTNVSRPQLRSTQMKDKVVPNTSQVKFKKTEVEGQHRISSISNQSKSVAFQKSTCFVRDIQGNDLLTDNRRSNLYTISLQETTSSTPICLMAKASPTQAWLWHRRLSHLNYDYINLLSKKDVVIGLPKLKYVKNQLCSSCEVSKAKRSSFKTKTVPSSKGRLNLLHMDLCGPMRVASINGKKYILVIVDDYSRYTWTLFLRSKDETPEVLKDFLTMIQRNLQAPVISVRTDRGTEFLNKTLNAFFKEEGIEHQTSTPRTPEQNGVVKRRNRTLVEAARTMLSASKLPVFFWAEAIATACYTQNRSIIILTHEKMAYHIINDRKPSIKHLHIFCCTCYLTRDGENLDKMKEKGDPCILVGYSTQSKGYRVYNKRTRLIVESIHLKFDEIKEMSETSVANDTSGLVPQRQKASDYVNSDPVPQLQHVSPSADTTTPSQQELDLLFGPLYDEFFNAGTSRVNKSSSPTDNSTQQDTLPTTNIHPTSEP